MVVRNIKITEIEKAKKIYSASFGTNEVHFNNHFSSIFGVFGEELLGLCQVDYIINCFENKKIAFINSVCVDAKYRNKGVATFLLKEVESIAKMNGCNEIMLTSSKKRKAANKLYEKLGFVIYDTNLFKKKI